MSNAISIFNYHHFITCIALKMNIIIKQGKHPRKRQQQPCEFGGTCTHAYAHLLFFNLIHSNTPCCTFDEISLSCASPSASSLPKHTHFPSITHNHIFLSAEMLYIGTTIANNIDAYGMFQN